MTKAEEVQYELGVTDTLTGIKNMLQDVIESNQDIDKIPSRMVVQVLLASIIHMEKNIADISTDSND